MSQARPTVQIMLYSDDANTRRAITSAVGHCLGPGSPEIDWSEVASPEAAKLVYKDDKFAALILDGEATPEGGISLARYFDSISAQLPPIVVLTARGVDDWLARWARVQATIAAPFDPFEVANTLREVLATR